MSPQFVADFMTIDPVVVRADDTISEAETLIRQYAISGLPVLDDDGRLVGVISQTDLLWRGGLPLDGLLRRTSDRIAVRELMSSPAITVPTTATLIEAARVMRDRRVHRVVATDEDFRPVGVLSAFDFVELYADG